MSDEQVPRSPAAEKVAQAERKLKIWAGIVIGGLIVVIVGTALLKQDDDKPTYGGGFESREECIDGWATLDPDLTRAERVAKCDGSSGEEQDPDDQLLACPEAMEVLAERIGGGFVRGVDPQYDPSMDWDGDGVSCE